MPKDVYLGDGVYASNDGYHIWLDTRGQSPLNRIALKPSVLVNLVQYASQFPELRECIKKEIDDK